MHPCKADALLQAFLLQSVSDEGIFSTCCQGDNKCQRSLVEIPSLRKPPIIFRTSAKAPTISSGLNQLTVENTAYLIQEVKGSSQASAQRMVSQDSCSSSSAHNWSLCYVIFSIIRRCGIQRTGCFSAHTVSAVVF